MAIDLKQAASSDLFFFYGQNDHAVETEAEIMSGVLQPQRQLFYDAIDGAGIDRYQSSVNGFMGKIQIAFSITRWAAWRNGQVTTGQYGYPDRRVIIGQQGVDLSGNGNEVDVGVRYVATADAQTSKNIQLPIGG